MKSIFFTMLLVIFGIVPSIHAENIIHDPEYHSMEQVMGEKWEANDKIVQERLAALEKKFGKNQISSVYWLTMLGIANSAFMAEENSGEPPHLIWIKWHIRV